MILIQKIKMPNHYDFGKYRMSPNDVRKKFEVPVFNIYTFIEWFQSGLLPTRFNSDHDDPRK